MPVPIPSPVLVKSILDVTDPGFEERAKQWARDEELYRAEAKVAKRLAPFTWETTAVKQPDYTGFLLRQERAVFIPNLQIRHQAVTGTIMQRAPKPGAGLTLGDLGEVRADRGAGNPTRAEMLYDNADGVGQDAQGLLAFVESEMGLASATDLRYIFVDAPPEAPRTLQDEIDGRRPYFVDFGPQQVPYAVYQAGTLVAVHVVTTERVRAVKEGLYTDETVKRHLLMTKTGFADWGEVFAVGGWWLFDDEGAVVTNASGTAHAGDWTKTGGQIPMTRMIWLRGASGEPLSSGASWLNNLSLAHMDAGSWQWNDLKVSGGRKRYWLGADPKQWEELVNQSMNGAVEVPVPARTDGGEVRPYDTGETNTGTAMRDYQAGLETQVRQFFLRELTTSPDASGAARIASELQGKSPLLAHVAGNLEEALWTMLRFAEMRWTGTRNPQSAVTFPRDFDLRGVVEKLTALVGVFKAADLPIPAAAAPLFAQAVDSTGLATEGGDVDLDVLADEVAVSLGATQVARQAAADASAAFEAARNRIDNPDAVTA